MKDFNVNIVYKWWVFRCHFWLPEGIAVGLAEPTSGRRCSPKLPSRSPRAGGPEPHLGRVWKLRMSQQYPRMMIKIMMLEQCFWEYSISLDKRMFNVLEMFAWCLHGIYCCPPIGVQQLFNRNLAPGMLRYVYVYIIYILMLLCFYSYCCYIIYTYIYNICEWYIALWVHGQ